MNSFTTGKPGENGLTTDSLVSTSGLTGMTYLATMDWPSSDRTKSKKALARAVLPGLALMAMGQGERKVPFRYLMASQL
ncbi:hypothetical protein B6U66_02210 [Candidatus Bathyarchaeota archaeon ex4484_135]|nr:MAG: hypothetical protein B6U66_02210 [Candidatus Bathyarchaeota archaeon ex4484_135]